MKLKCLKCKEKDSVWFYMPGTSHYCDDCVPRGCSYCNSDDEGNELPKPWEPCIEYMKDDDYVE
jgi:hypothetical protein